MCIRLACSLLSRTHGGHEGDSDDERHEELRLPKRAHKALMESEFRLGWQKQAGSLLSDLALYTSDYEKTRIRGSMRYTSLFSMLTTLENRCIDRLVYMFYL